jgi:UDP-N-acetylmuramate--alanine ligase
MYEIDFHHPIHIYFIGIGGISMSGLAEILLSEGFTISGSDLAETELTATLANKGAQIYYEQKPENLAQASASKQIDLVVYTAAIKEDNPEYRAMQEYKLPSLTRAELLGQIMKNYQTAIAVAGTHGKTTTTSMVSAILLNAGLDPTLTIGGIYNAINGNVRLGKTAYFVTEACEYTNSFLKFFPTVGLIMNIEADHLDFFKDIEEIRESFRRFAALLPANGALIINGEIEKLPEITKGLPCTVITFGKGASYDYNIEDIDYDQQARASFTLHRQGNDSRKRYSLGTCGEHNVYNAVAALALADYLDLDPQEAQKSLQAFKGTERRFELKGNKAGFTIIDDYAHHPTEIIATLKTARYFSKRRLCCVFQPHTYTRTKALLPEFAAALSLADWLIIVDIYAAREKNTVGISGKDLAEAIAALGNECYYMPTSEGFSAVEKFILKNLQEDDLLITMGAGDVVTIADNLLKK